MCCALYEGVRSGSRQWLTAMRPAKFPPICSGARPTGSSARCEYSSAVVILLCPSSRPTTFRFCPLLTPKLAKVWRRSWIRTSGISASRQIRSHTACRLLRGWRLGARDHDDLVLVPVELLRIAAAAQLGSESGGQHSRSSFGTKAAHCR